MSFEVLTIPLFEKQLKSLVKKYPSLKQEFAVLIESLEINPKQGQALGNECYKIRLAIRSKRSGKSGGARLITHIVFIKKVVYLLSIYDKSDHESLSNKEIQSLIKCFL